MRKKHEVAIQQKVVESYKNIAVEFSATRQKPWGEFHHFLSYVPQGAKVLDLGCGNGRLYEFLKQKEVQYLGVDNNGGLLAEARKSHPEAEFKQQDMVDLTVEPESFDVVMGIASFHHLPSKKIRKKAIWNMHKALKQNGVLILTVWNLFQKKYMGAVMRAVLFWIVTFGFKYKWNDTWIKWGHSPTKRYYHAFLPKEFRHYFNEDLWEIKEFYFTKRGNRVRFLQSFNMVLIARKK